MNQRLKTKVRPNPNDSRLRRLEKRIEELEGKLYHVAEVVSYNAKLLHPAFTQVDANIGMIKSVIEDICPPQQSGLGLPQIDWQSRYDDALKKVLEAQGDEEEPTPDTEPAPMEATFGGDYGQQAT